MSDLLHELAHMRMQTNIELARELVADFPDLSMAQAITIVERERRGE